MVSKDITTIKEVISAFVISFNYFEYANEIAKTFYSNLKEFVFTINPLLNPNNAFNIDVSNLKRVNLNFYKNEELLKKHIVQAYLVERGGFSNHIIKLFYDSDVINLEYVKKILEFSGSDLDEYLDYLNEINEENSVKNEDVLDLILNGHSPKKKDKNKFEHVIFKDVAYCACGRKSDRKVNRTSPVIYYCSSKTRKKRGIHCSFKGAKEETILKKVHNELGVMIENREQASMLINKVTIESENNLTIEYRDVLNSKR